jgi:plasmid stabilization system protein ParE
MPQIIITPPAALGMIRCRQFLTRKNRQASIKASKVIKHHLALLSADPHIGRLVSDSPYLRELVIAFGSSGYVAFYRYDPKSLIIPILSFKHQKELEYLFYRVDVL